MNKINKIEAALPWIPMMEIAYGVLRLSPVDFWTMTPCEWMAGLKGWKDRHGLSLTAEPAMTRKELEELKRQFPDYGTVKPVDKAFMKALY